MLLLLSTAFALTCVEFEAEPMAGIGPVVESTAILDAEAIAEAQAAYRGGDYSAWAAAYDNTIRLDHAAGSRAEGSVVHVMSVEPLVVGEVFTVWTASDQARKGAPCSSTQAQRTVDRDYDRLEQVERRPPPEPIETDEPLAIPVGQIPPEKAPVPEPATTQRTAPPAGMRRLSVDFEGRVKVMGSWHTAPAEIFLKPAEYTIVVDAGGKKSRQTVRLDKNRDLCGEDLRPCSD